MTDPINSNMQTAATAAGWASKTWMVRAGEALPDAWWMTVAFVLAGLLALVCLITFIGLILIYAERKIAGHFQCRLGPMRAGPHGILQTVADTIKLLFKEDIVPTYADKVMHLAAPFLVMATTLLTLAMIPYSPLFHIVDLNIGVMFVSAVTGLSVMGILLAGWSSNNKWALVGAMRSGAQIVSYELSASLALLVVVLYSGSMSMYGVVESQQAGWWIWRAHGTGVVAFLLFLISSTAEINRTPFDIPEGESELTAGFHTEYSGLRFSFFFLSEFVNVFVVAALAVTFFFGGWMPFHVGNWAAFNGVMDLLPPGLWFLGKSSFVVFLIMWFRWTFPRMRVDQLMALEWKFLLPIGFINLLAAAVAVIFNLYFFPVS